MKMLQSTGELELSTALDSDGACRGEFLGLLAAPFEFFSVNFWYARSPSNELDDWKEMRGE